MILYTDKDGKYLGHLDYRYPADEETLERIRKEQDGPVLDVPPFAPEFWYFPEGVPTVRPMLAYAVTEKEDGDDKVTVISGIPAGTTVNVHGPEGIQTVEADGEDLELVLRLAGDYAVSFEAFPHQAVSIHLQVTEA